VSDRQNKVVLKNVQARAQTKSCNQNNSDAEPRNWDVDCFHQRYKKKLSTGQNTQTDGSRSPTFDGRQTHAITNAFLDQGHPKKMY